MIHHTRTVMSYAHAKQGQQPWHVSVQKQGTPSGKPPPPAAVFQAATVVWGERGEPVKIDRDHLRALIEVAQVDADLRAFLVAEIEGRGLIETEAGT